MPDSRFPVRPTIDSLRHALAVAELLAETEPEAARAVILYAIRQVTKSKLKRP